VSRRDVAILAQQRDDARQALERVATERDEARRERHTWMQRCNEVADIVTKFADDRNEARADAVTNGQAAERLAGELAEARAEVVRLGKALEQATGELERWRFTFGSSALDEDAEFEGWLKRVGLDGFTYAQADRLTDEQVEERIERIKQTAAEWIEARRLRAALDEERIEPRPSVHKLFTKSYAIDQITDVERLRAVAHRMWEAFAACHEQSAHIIGALIGNSGCEQCARASLEDGQPCDRYAEWQKKVTDGFGSV
jgi:hypothetical protein